jgi:hypothetical protein
VFLISEASIATLVGAILIAQHRTKRSTFIRSSLNLN